MKKRHFKPVGLFALVVMLVATVMTMVSCGDDEPQMVVNYYLDVEEAFRINSSTALIDRYYNPKTRMEQAIKAAYPNPDMDGDDDAVLEACDREFAEYVEMYTGGAEHFTCLMHLMKAEMVDGIARHNVKLRTYSYDINPPGSSSQDPED